MIKNIDDLLDILNLKLDAIGYVVLESDLQLFIKHKNLFTLHNIDVLYRGVILTIENNLQIGTPQILGNHWTTNYEVAFKFACSNYNSYNQTAYNSGKCIYEINNINAYSIDYELKQCKDLCKSIQTLYINKSTPDSVEYNLYTETITKISNIIEEYTLNENEYIIISSKAKVNEIDYSSHIPTVYCTLLQNEEQLQIS